MNLHQHNVELRHLLDHCTKGKIVGHVVMVQLVAMYPRPGGF